MASEGLPRLLARIAPVQERLAAHPVYAAVRSKGDLAVFMEHHVFAVWDFMALLKWLQRRFTGLDVPWVPVGDRHVRHFVNAVVAEEESDPEGPDGPASHFETYLDAMRDVGADRAPVDTFVDDLVHGISLEGAIRRKAVPAAAREFVLATWATVESDDPLRIGAQFALGREHAVPPMFRRLIDHLDAGGNTARFRHYLDRHVGLDEHEHGPMALQMLGRLCGDDPEAWARAEAAVVDALEARLVLWDGVLAAIQDAATARAVAASKPTHAPSPA